MAHKIMIYVNISLLFSNSDYFWPILLLSGKMSEVPPRLTISYFFTKYKEMSIIFLFFYLE
jgi:hypothetical protein